MITFSTAPFQAHGGRRRKTVEKTLDESTYFLEKLKHLPTPRLVVYRREFDSNVERMKGYLEDIVPGSGFDHLTPHAKTHKSLWVTQQLMAAGVRRFKCGPNELDTLLEAGARDIFLAYPPLPHDADKLARRIRKYSHASISSQIGCFEHATFLQEAAERFGVTIPCFLDLDVGNGRTGAGVEKILELAKQVSRGHRFSNLRICGLHGYDGHNGSADPGQRIDCAREAMGRVVKCWQAIKLVGVAGDRVVVGGTLGFREDLRELFWHHELKAQIEVSPGTWVYWDTGYDNIMPGAFDFAALVLAQVMDLPGDNRVCLNLGYKGWAIDNGPAELFSVSGLGVVMAKEEHTVLRCDTSTPTLHVGDHVLIAPRHVCSTVNLWEEFTLVGKDGHILEESLPVSARNR